MKIRGLFLMVTMVGSVFGGAGVATSEAAQEVSSSEVEEYTQEEKQYVLNLFLRLARIPNASACDYIALLRQDGVNFDEPTGSLQGNRLLQAAQNGDEHLVLALIKNGGASAFHVDQEGRTVLHHALFAGHADVVRAVSSALSREDFIEVCKKITTQSIGGTACPQGSSALHMVTATLDRKPAKTSAIGALAHCLGKAEFAHLCRMQNTYGRNVFREAGWQNRADVLKELKKALSDNADVWKIMIGASDENQEHTGDDAKQGLAVIHDAFELAGHDVVNFLLSEMGVSLFMKRSVTNSILPILGDNDNAVCRAIRIGRDPHAYLLKKLKAWLGEKNFVSLMLQTGAVLKAVGKTEQLMVQTLKTLLDDDIFQEELKKESLHNVACMGNDKSLAAMWEGKSQQNMLNQAKITDSSGKTLLHVAAEGGKEKVVNMLSARLGASFDELVDLKDSKGYTAFHYAAENGHHGVVSELHREMRARFKALCACTDSHGRTPLHIAAEKGHTDFIKTVKNLLHDDFSDIAKLSCKAGNTCLHYAVQKEHIDCMTAIRDGATESDTQSFAELLAHSNKQGWTVLHVAADTGQSEMLNALSSAHNFAHVCSVPTNDGKTVLYLAANNGHGAVCKWLYDNYKSLFFEQFVCNAGTGNDPLTCAQKRSLVDVESLLKEVFKEAPVSMRLQYSAERSDNQAVLDIVMGGLAERPDIATAARIATDCKNIDLADQLYDYLDRD